ncbi:hypothetical protein IMY05_C4235001200 [Salix suchowensis]|nr:hypothetical protein IMY05_C4235001200 [Salix suchowensis]
MAQSTVVKIPLSGKEITVRQVSGKDPQLGANQVVLSRTLNLVRALCHFVCSRAADALQNANAATPSSTVGEVDGTGPISSHTSAPLYQTLIYEYDGAEHSGEDPVVGQGDHGPDRPVNPATEEAICSVVAGARQAHSQPTARTDSLLNHLAGSVKDIDVAVAAAREAFRTTGERM